MHQHCNSVLVVEDNEDIRQAIEDLLHFEDYPVLSAENGRQALDILRTAPRPCLVLLDLMMPVMNGWEFLELRRVNDVMVTIPVVVVTAVDEAKATAIQGVDSIVKKPINLELLLECVQRYCRPKEAA